MSSLNLLPSEAFIYPCLVPLLIDLQFFRPCHFFLLMVRLLFGLLDNSLALLLVRVTPSALRLFNSIKPQQFRPFQGWFSLLIKRARPFFRLIHLSIVSLTLSSILILATQVIGLRNLLLQVTSIFILSSFNFGKWPLRFKPFLQFSNYH